MDNNIIEGSGTTTGTDTYAVTLSVGIDALVTNGLYLITFANANTGASTLNINGLGIKTIKNKNGGALTAGQIKANIPNFLIFDGTDFIAVTISSEQSDVKEVFYRVDNSNDNSGDYLTKEILSNGSGFFAFRVPFDFVSLVDLKLVMIPQSTRANADIDLFSDYASVGEPKNFHSEDDTTTTYSFTLDEMTEIDISGVFSSITAGDYGGLKVDHKAAGVQDYLGIRIKYNI